MSPSNLFPVTLWSSLIYGDSDAWQDFLGTHGLWHRVLARSTRTAFVLTDDLRREKLRHAQMHEQVAHALGIAPAASLVDVDFNDRGAWQAWHQLHALDHQRLQISAGL